VICQQPAGRGEEEGGGRVRGRRGREEERHAGAEYIYINKIDQERAFSVAGGGGRGRPSRVPAGGISRYRGDRR